ncbi:MAG: hypothetical protein EHM70_07575 [Chloroflexota bacterium]|nr:MAG: hypothetical protein EHM70_07575 [Chloroflexota bacterium]
MDERKRSEIFNQHLDDMLQGKPVDGSAEMPEEVRQALDLAGQLARVDFSTESRHQKSLRGRWLGQAASQGPSLQRRTAFFGGLSSAARSLAAVAAVIGLVLALNWAFSSLIPIPSIEWIFAAASPTPTSTAAPGSPTPVHTLPATATPMKVHPPEPYSPPGVVSTLSPAAKCPKADPYLVPGFTSLSKDEWPDLEIPILDYLNSGGTLDPLLIVLKDAGWKPEVLRSDFTRDGVPELAIRITGLYVYGCSKGKYQTLLKVTSESRTYPPAIILNMDMNRNGVPEIVVNRQDAALTPTSAVQILEWDGRAFHNQVTQPDIWSRHQAYGGVISGTIYMKGAWIDIRDTDNNKTLELVISGGVPLYGRDSYALGPWRSETHTYMWDGKGFVLVDMYQYPAKYRFQAVQDADEASAAGDYALAMTLYQTAIFTDTLEGWSPLISEYTIQRAEGLTPTRPAPEPGEYNRLAAYSRYRIMLLHTARGWQVEAQTVYDYLQRLFPQGNSGHPYAELATAFWTEYQATKDMSQACAAARDYAAEHQDDVLTLLGSAYYGPANRDYQPEDVCPFE